MAFFSEHSFRLCSWNEFGHIRLLNLLIFPCSAFQYKRLGLIFLPSFFGFVQFGLLPFLRSAFVFLASLWVTHWRSINDKTTTFRFNKSVCSIFEFPNVKIIKRGKANDNASQRRDYSLTALTTAAGIFHRSNTDAFQFPGDLRFATK